MGGGRADVGGLSGGVGSQKPCKEQEAGSELSFCPRVFWKVLGAAAVAGVGPLVPEAQLSHASQNRKGKGSEHCDGGQASQPWAFFGMKRPHSHSPHLVQLCGQREAGICPGGWEGVPSHCREVLPLARRSPRAVLPVGTLARCPPQTLYSTGGDKEGTGCGDR